jgi:hypothetical protein
VLFWCSIVPANQLIWPAVNRFKHTRLGARQANEVPQPQFVENLGFWGSVENKNHFSGLAISALQFIYRRFVLSRTHPVHCIAAENDTKLSQFQFRLVSHRETFGHF